MKVLCIAVYSVGVLKILYMPSAKNITQNRTGSIINSLSLMYAIIILLHIRIEERRRKILKEGH